MIRTRVIEEPKPIVTEIKVSKPKAQKPVEKRGRGRPSPGKKAITIRLDADLLAIYKLMGKNYQSRINEALRKVAGI